MTDNISAINTVEYVNITNDCGAQHDCSVCAETDKAIKRLISGTTKVSAFQGFICQS